MPSWSGKTRGGISGYKTIVFVIQKFGLGTAYFFLNFVVLYFIISSPKSNKAAYFHFRKIHGYSVFKTLVKIYQNYHLFGQTLIDKITVLSGTSSPLRFTYEGENHLHGMAENKTGGILISAHMGSFEIAGYLLKRIDAKINILMFEAEHEKIKHFLSSVYKDHRAHIITMKDDLQHLYEIKSAFENNELLCLHGDRFVNDSKILKRKLMNHNASFPAGPFVLAQKFDVPVSFVFAMKESKYSYHFYATEPKVYYQEKLNPAKKQEHLEQILSDYVHVLQDILKKFPEQWFNFYYFWDPKE